MLQNYLKIALRNLARSKVYSLINISGLSLGIACCLLLALYVQDEFGYDRHHIRLEDLYRVNTQFQASVVGFNKLGSVSPPITMALKQDIPEVEAATRVISPFGGQYLFHYEDKVFYERDGLVADSTLFDVLTYDLSEGNPKKALTDANTIILSESLARKLFGNQLALNKSITISQGDKPVNYKVTGVFRENHKSFLTARYFTSMMSEGMGDYIRNNPNAAGEWAGQNFVQAYLKLTPNHDIAAVNRKINEVLVKYGSEDMKALGFSKTLFLEPVKDIYLKSQVDASQRITYIYIIVSIAAFILLLACINFMNLSTAKATKRASEIGIRKVMGAFRSALIRQILGEAMVIVLISVVLSIFLVLLALPVFNELSAKSISFNSGNVSYFAIALTLLTVLTGLVAGSYPAFYMSSFQPAQVLKGKFTLSGASGKLRQGLVVFQFVVAIVLVCGMLIITKQLAFMKDKNLGFDDRAKIIIPLRTNDANKAYEGMRNEIQRLSSVKAVSAGAFAPGSQIFSDMAFYRDGGSMETAILNRRNAIDAGYMELLGIQLIAGRTFTSNRKSESDGKLIINRASAKKFGLDPTQMIGIPLHFDWQGKKYNFEVIGVMDDYNQTSLRDPILPIVFEMPGSSEDYQFMIASVAPTGFSNTIKNIEKIWKKSVGDTPFEYSFLDQDIQRQYEEDQRISKIITNFTIIAMIICSLGLYGLSSFMAERRLKEIGVRKVMGASVGQIVGMMSKEFVRLVGIAFVVSIPIAWYAMTKWLEGFEYKAGIDIMVFVLAGLGATAIALVTISYESFHAANSNPVVSLRNE